MHNNEQEMGYALESGVGPRTGSRGVLIVQMRPLQIMQISSLGSQAFPVDLRF